MLGELYLQAALPGLGPAAKDVQDQPGSVYDLQPVQRILQIALLGWGELVVADDRMGVQLHRPSSQLVDLTLAQISMGRPIDSLADRADDLGAHASGELCKLAHRVFRGPSGGAPFEMSARQEHPLHAAPGRNHRLGGYGWSSYVLRGTASDSMRRSPSSSSSSDIVSDSRM